MEQDENYDADWWTRFREIGRARGCEANDAALCRFGPSCLCRREANAAVVVEGLARLASPKPPQHGRLRRRLDK
jgi:hypothetical protein